MSKSKTAQHAAASAVPQLHEGSPEQAKARAALKPSINAVLAIDAFKGNLMGTDVDLGAMVESLQATIKDVQGGDLRRLEAMLVAQSTVLQTMFTSLARRAMSQEYVKHTDTYLSLALKAQAQSRATISALVDLKYPKQATFIKQANVAHGPQQVNNGAQAKGGGDVQKAPTDQPAALPLVPSPAPSRAKKSKTRQTELLVGNHGSTQLDT